MSDVKTFVPEDLHITTVDGNKMKVPRLNWKKELQLIDIIQNVLKDVAPGFSRPNQTPIDIVSKILEIAPQKATRFVAIVMNQDDNWVEENLDISEVVAVILPLLRSRLDLILRKLQPYLQEMGVQLPIQE